MQIFLHFKAKDPWSTFDLLFNIKVWQPAIIWRPLVTKWLTSAVEWRGKVALIIYFVSKLDKKWDVHFSHVK